LPGNLRHHAQPLRQQGFQPLAQQPRQYRRLAAAGNGDLDGVAVDNRGEDEVAAGGVVHRVHQQAAALRGLEHPLVQIGIVGGGHGEEGRVEQFRRERVRRPLHPARAVQRGHFRMQPGRRNADKRAAAQQQADFAQSHMTRAHHQHGAAFQIDKQGEVVHFRSHSKTVRLS
jgi:hypothetical protein